MAILLKINRLLLVYELLSWNNRYRSYFLRFETTVQRPVEATGVGLHSGVPVRIRIQPAPVSTGIVFVRTDLDNFQIPANWRYVARVSYATSLMRQGVLISTTEHLLSVFYSSGIDNAYVEIDNLEVPILDGSGQPFVELLAEAGIRALSAQAQISAHPPSDFRGGDRQADHNPARRTFPPHLRYFFKHPMVGGQSLEMEVTPERYAARNRAGAHVRLRIRAGPDAQHGTDSRRVARERSVFQSRIGAEPRRSAFSRRMLPAQGAGPDR